MSATPVLQKAVGVMCVKRQSDLVATQLNILRVSLLVSKAQSFSKPARASLSSSTHTPPPSPKPSLPPVLWLHQPQLSPLGIGLIHPE